MRVYFCRTPLIKVVSKFRTLFQHVYRLELGADGISGLPALQSAHRLANKLPNTYWGRKINR